MPFVVWTTNDGLTAIQGSGGSQGHTSCSAIPLKDVVTTGAGWATTSGPATAAVAEESATGRIDDGASRSVVALAWTGSARRDAARRGRGWASARRADAAALTCVPRPSDRPATGVPDGRRLAPACGDAAIPAVAAPRLAASRTSAGRDRSTALTVRGRRAGSRRRRPIGLSFVATRRPSRTPPG